MLKIIGVRFKSVGKIYYFDPKDYDVKMGDKVIVETARGVECGEVALVDREIDETRFTNPVKGIIRLATPNDMKTIEKNRQKEKDAFKICEQKITAHKLKMNLIDVECTFDNNKLLFYFTAESRVDFRELVKDLAAVFRTRIELRQIGVRDEAKCLGVLASADSLSAVQDFWESSSLFLLKWLRSRACRLTLRRSQALAEDLCAV